MTILKVTVEDNQADLLEKLLKEFSYVKNIEVAHEAVVSTSDKSESTLARVKALLDSAKGKNLFKDIEDPAEWQRELRKEWDRDF